MSEQISIQSDFDHWAIVELMGHVRMTGRLTEVELFGSKLGKLAVIDRSGAVIATQYFGGASVYRITACTEETARELAHGAVSAGPEVPWSVQQTLRAEYEQRYQDRIKELEAPSQDTDEEDDDERIF